MDKSVLRRSPEVGLVQGQRPRRDGSFGWHEREIRTRNLKLGVCDTGASSGCATMRKSLSYSVENDYVVCFLLCISLVSESFPP